VIPRAKCRHGLWLAPAPMYAALECPACLPSGETVSEFVARHPLGADASVVAEALGITRQGVAVAEVRAVRKLLRRLDDAAADDGEAAPMGERGRGRVRGRRGGEDAAEGRRVARVGAR